MESRGGIQAKPQHSLPQSARQASRRLTTAVTATANTTPSRQLPAAGNGRNTVSARRRSTATAWASRGGLSRQQPSIPFPSIGGGQNETIKAPSSEFTFGMRPAFAFSPAATVARGSDGSLDWRHMQLESMPAFSPASPVLSIGTTTSSSHNHSATAYGVHGNGNTTTTASSARTIRSQHFFRSMSINVDVIPPHLDPKQLSVKSRANPQSDSPRTDLLKRELPRVRFNISIQLNVLKPGIAHRIPVLCLRPDRSAGADDDPQASLQQFCLEKAEWFLLASGNEDPGKPRSTGHGLQHNADPGGEGSPVLPPQGNASSLNSPRGPRYSAHTRSSFMRTLTLTKERIKRVTKGDRVARTLSRSNSHTSQKSAASSAGRRMSVAEPYHSDGDPDFGDPTEGAITSASRRRSASAMSFRSPAVNRTKSFFARESKVRLIDVSGSPRPKSNQLHRVSAQPDRMSPRDEGPSPTTPNAQELFDESALAYFENDQEIGYLVFVTSRVGRYNLKIRFSTHSQPHPMVKAARHTGLPSIDSSCCKYRLPIYPWEWGSVALQGLPRALSNTVKLRIPHRRVELPLPPSPSQPNAGEGVPSEATTATEDPSLLVEFYDVAQECPLPVMAGGDVNSSQHCQSAVPSATFLSPLASAASADSISFSQHHEPASSRGCILSHQPLSEWSVVSESSAAKTLTLSLTSTINKISSAGTIGCSSDSNSIGGSFYIVTLDRPASMRSMQTGVYPTTRRRMRRLRGQARAGADGSPIVLCRDLHLKRPPLPELFVNPQSAGEATHCLSPAWSSSSCSSFEATDGEDIAEGIKVDEIGKDSDFDRHFDTKIDDFLKEYGTTTDGRRDTLSLEQLQGLPDEVGRQSPNRENDIRKEDRAASVNLEGEPARVGRFDDDPFGLHEPSASTYMQDEEERRPEAKDVTACSSDDSDNKSNNDEEDDGHSAHSDKRSVDGADAVDDLDAELDIDDDGVDAELAQITSIAFDPTEVVTLSWYPQILSAISNIATARDADKTRGGASPGESDQADALTRPFDVSLVASTPSPQLAPANPASANGGRCTDEAEEEQESLPAVGHLRDGDSSGWKHPRLGFLRSQLSPVLSRDVTPAQHDLQLASSLACFEGISILQDIDAPIVHPDIMDPAIGYIGVGAGESATEQGAVTPIPVPASTILVGPLTSSGIGGSPDRWNSPVVTPLPKKTLADENLGGPPLFPPPSVHVASCLYNISLSSFTLQARVTVQDLPPLEDQHYSIRIYVNSPYVALPSLDIKWAPARLTLTLVRGEGLVSFSSPGPSATADMTGIDYQGLPVDIVLRAQPLSLGSAGKASAAPPPPSAVDLTVVARIESPIPPHDMVLTDAFTLAIPATQNAVVVHTPGLPTCCEANQDGNVNTHVKIAGLESTLPSLVIEGIDPMLVPTPNTAASVDCAVMLEKHDWLIYSVASREVLYSRSLTIARNIAINYWSSSLMNDNFAETPLCLSYFTRYAYHIDYGAFEGCKSRAGADGGIATLELDVCTLRPHFMRIGSLVERSRLRGAPFSHDTDDKPCDDMLIDESTVPVVVIDVPVASHEDLRLIRLNGQEVVPVFRRQNDNKSITLLLTINRNVSQLSEVAADTIRISFSVGPPPKPDDEDSSVGVPRVHGSYAHLFVSLGEGDMWCGLDPVNIIPTALESASLRVSLPTGPSIEGRGHEAAWALHEVKPVIDYLSLSTFPVPEVDNDKSAYPTATFNSASKVCRRQLLHGSSIQEFSLLKQSSFDDTINTVDAFPPYDYMMSIKPRSGEPLSKSQSPPLLMQANDVPEKARGMKAGLAEPDAAPNGTDGDAQDTLGEEQHPHSMPESLKMLFEKDEEEDGDSNSDEEVAGRNSCDKPVEEKHENGDTSGPNQAGGGESVDTTDATPPLALETRQKCRGGLTLGQSFCWFLVAIVGAVIMAAAAFLAQRSNVTAILNIHSPGSAGHKALGTGLPTTAARAEADQEPYMAATATVLAVTTTADATMVGNIHNDGIEDQGHTRSNPGLRQSPPYIVKYRPKRPALSTTMEQGVMVAWGEVIKFFDNLKRAVGEYIQQRLAQLENKPDGNNDSVPPT